MSEDERKKWSIVSGEKFQEILDEAQLVITLVTEAKISMVAAGFAGAALVRMAAQSTGGDVEWWCDVVRRGGEAIEKLRLPEGATLARGPEGKQ